MPGDAQAESLRA